MPATEVHAAAMEAPGHCAVKASEASTTARGESRRGCYVSDPAGRGETITGKPCDGSVGEGVRMKSSGEANAVTEFARTAEGSRMAETSGAAIEFAQERAGRNDRRGGSQPCAGPR